LYIINKIIRKNAIGLYQTIYIWSPSNKKRTMMWVLYIHWMNLRIIFSNLYKGKTEFLTPSSGQQNTRSFSTLVFCFYLCIWRVGISFNISSNTISEYMYI
jgi:hypothetical protein